MHIFTVSFVVAATLLYVNCVEAIDPKLRNIDNLLEETYKIRDMRNPSPQNKIFDSSRYNKKMKINEVKDPNLNNEYSKSITSIQNMINANRSDNDLKKRSEYPDLDTEPYQSSGSDLRYRYRHGDEEANDDPSDSQGPIMDKSLRPLPFYGNRGYGSARSRSHHTRMPWPSQRYGDHIEPYGVVAPYPNPRSLFSDNQVPPNTGNIISFSYPMPAVIVQRIVPVVVPHPFPV